MHRRTPLIIFDERFILFFQQNFLRFLLVLAAWSSSPLKSEEVLFLGDSISTGGASHQDIRFDSGYLRQIFGDEVQRIFLPELSERIVAQGFSPFPLQQQPRFLPLARREFLGGLLWFYQSTLRAISQRYLDTPQYAWSMILASKFTTKSQDVFLAADDGSRLASGPRQVDRYLETVSTKLPGKVFVFFTGNDLCGPSMSYVTSASDYERQLSQLLTYINRNAQPADSGSDIFILDPISVMQLVQSQEILDKEVPAHGKTMTCLSLQKSNLLDLKSPGKSTDVTNPTYADAVLPLLPQRPNDYCSTVFTPENTGELANRIREYRGRIKAVASAFSQRRSNKEFQQGFRIHHLESSGNISFGAEDIANDCFHLSGFGHLKMAQKLYLEIQEKISSTEEEIQPNR